VSPTPTAAAGPRMTPRPRPEIRDVPPRKRGFSLHADRVASESAQPVRVVNPGRHKTIAIVIAAVLVLGAVGFVTFGRDLVSGVLGEPSTAASGAPTSTSAAAGHRAATASGAATPSAGSASPHAPTTAVGVANPSSPSHAVFQTSVTTAPAKTESAHSKSVAAAAAATHVAGPDATEIAPKVPNVNVDAATRSIDEATKSAPPKPKNTTPF